jgi:hypothetical protein
MARQRINDVQLYYELAGDGDDTVVLVHGSWTDFGLAARRPDLVIDVAAHEPPLLGVAPRGTLAAQLAHVHSATADVEVLLHSGDLEGGARHFVEHIALGPGTWQMLPDEHRRTIESFVSANTAVGR